MKKEEFKLRKELIELQHKLKMEEIRFEKKCRDIQNEKRKTITRAIEKRDQGSRSN